MATLVWSFIRRDLLLAASYRMAFVLQLLAVVCAVPVLYFISQVFGNDVAALKPYGGRYFGFVVLGMAFQDYVTVSQSMFTTSVREHQLMGTLEIVMLSPIPVPMILLASSLWGYLFNSVRFALYLALGVAFGLDLSQVNPISLLVLFPAAILSFAALGILAAAITIIIKRGEPLLMLLTGATVALGGVAYPISVLPEPLQWVARLLPFTHALEGIRKALLAGAAPGELLRELAALAGFAALLFPVALLGFSLAVRHAKATGTLGQY